VVCVRNARAVGQVTLGRSRCSETGALVELGPAEAAPVLYHFAMDQVHQPKWLWSEESGPVHALHSEFILQQYVTAIPIIRPFFDATPDAPLEAFVVEALHHPVFRIHDISG
jgi:hypothetical protein